jgi:hypothetical protein
MWTPGQIKDKMRWEIGNWKEKEHGHQIQLN